VDRSSARRRSRASSTGGRSPGGFGAGGRKGRKHMQLSLQSAPVSRGSSPRGQLDDLDGRSAVSPSQVATRLEQRSWELQGDSFVEDGYGHQRGHGRPHTTPLPLSSSRHEVLQRLYTADKTRRSPRLERSFSQREQMEAAQRSLRQHMEGDRLIAKIDAILGHSRSTSGVFGVAVCAVIRCFPESATRSHPTSCAHRTAHKHWQQAGADDFPVVASIHVHLRTPRQRSFQDLLWCRQSSVLLHGGDWRCAD